jgi:glycolate oxidase iron-sulfur subunit
MSNPSKNDQDICVKCGTCNTACPVFLATGNEIYAPRGKQHLKVKLTGNRGSRHYAEIFSKCLLCGACADACPRGLDTPEMVIKVRAELPRLLGSSFLKYVSRQALRHPSVLTNLTRVGSVANSLLENMLPEDSGLRLRLQGFNSEICRPASPGYIEKLRADSAAEPDAPEAKINFYSGCLANYLQPEIAQATQDLLLKTTGTKARVPFSQTCCGMASLAAGRKDEARKLARENIMAFADNDYPILTSCSSCYFQLKSYGELFADEPEWQQRARNFSGRLLEFSTYFLESLSGGSVLPPLRAGSSGQKVLYHDPCHLRFRLGITEEPRRLIKLLPGIDLRELPEGSKCCGQGGLFRVVHPELAREIQAGLLSDFGRLEVHTVLTGCSGCLLQWQQGLAGSNTGCRAEHLAVFIARLLQQKCEKTCS